MQLAAHLRSYQVLSARVRLHIAQCQHVAIGSTGLDLAPPSLLQCTCHSLDGWMNLMRFLRPRMPAVSRLHLRVATVEGVSRRRRFLSRCHAALAALASRLAAAPLLQELSLCWEVAYHFRGRYDGPRTCFFADAEPRIRLLEPPDLQALLSAPGRKRGGSLPLPLRRLHLGCCPEVVLPPALSGLPQLDSLVIGRPGRAWGSLRQGFMLAGNGGSSPCVLPTLTSLTLHAAHSIGTLAACRGLAAALPALRELRMAVQFEEWEEEEYKADGHALLAALSPLAGQLEVSRAAVRTVRGWARLLQRSAVEVRWALLFVPHRRQLPPGFTPAGAQVLELPPGCLPPVVSACTGLRTLVVRRLPSSCAGHWTRVLPELR
jgi:hypothetical protein